MIKFSLRFHALKIDVPYRTHILRTCTTTLKLASVGSRVGKVSGIEVSSRVSGMPEMPCTKPGFGRPKLPKTINLVI